MNWTLAIVIILNVALAWTWVLISAHRERKTTLQLDEAMDRLDRRLDRDKSSRSIESRLWFMEFYLNFKQGTKKDPSTMRPLSELTIGHIGKRIHIHGPSLEYTGTLTGIEVSNGTEWALATPAHVGPRVRFALTFLSDFTADTLELDRAEFEVIDQ